MKRNRPGTTLKFSCRQETGSLPCPLPSFQRHRAEDLVRGAIRKDNQTFLDGELLNRGQKEFPRHRQLEPRNSHLSRLVLLSKASLTADPVVIAAPGGQIQGRTVWDDPGARGVQGSGKNQHMDPGPAALVPDFVLPCVLGPGVSSLSLAEAAPALFLTGAHPELCLLSKHGLCFHLCSCLS